jgi:CHAD domain-containing protein
MAYRLKPGRPIDQEVRRIVDTQLARAVDQLRHTGDPRSDAAVHEARRHIKKVRAVLRLVQPTLGDEYAAANRRLQAANRMLAPIADGEAVVDTIARLKGEYGPRLPARTLKSIRAALMARAAKIDRKATLDRVLPRVGAVLRVQRGKVRLWRLDAHGFRTVAGGLEKTVRRARKAMRRAAQDPTADHFHAWRRRVKDLWFQIRLVEERCGNTLLADQRRLEELDGCLGEYHNVVLLERVLMTEALLSRRQTARCLRLLREVQTQLRRRAVVQARRIFSEKPKHIVRRVHRLWRAAKATHDGVETGASCQRVA